MPLEFKIGRLRYTWKGQWTTGSFYNRDAVSQYNGKTYVCLEPHTAQADFYDDLYYIRPEDGASLPRWELMIDGRAWKQDWQPNTAYSLGNIVRYGGIVYICTVNHTSGPSVIDLANWTTYFQFDNWDNDWQVSNDYSANELVKYGGIVYRCINDHQSAATETEGLEANQSDWEVVNNGVEYKGDWSYPTRYKLNDLVKIGADIYRSKEGHTSAEDLDGTKWALWIPGQQYTDGWDETLIYQPGDIVIYGGYSYINLITNNVGFIPTVSPTYADPVYTTDSVDGAGIQYNVIKNGNTYEVEIVSPGVNYVAAETITVLGSELNGVDVVNDLVITIDTVGGNGDILTISVSGVASVHWELVTQGYNSRDLWMPGDYRVGDIVRRGGSLYVAIADNSGEDPFGTQVLTTVTNISGTTLSVNSTDGIISGMIIVAPGFAQGQTVVSVVDGNDLIINEIPNADIQAGSSIEFVGVNIDYWRLVVPTIDWVSFWELGTEYLIGQLVVWKNGTYRCIRTHTGNEFFRPDLDVDNSFWIVHSLHAKENAGNSQGDIVTLKDGNTAAVPIGDSDQHLSVSGTSILWKNIAELPDIFYVATDGVDEDGYGLSPDKPWASVAYACNQVKNGFSYQNANELLTTNKDFLIEEMYQWMLYQKDNNQTPFTTLSEFDEYSTRRDAKLVIDAISYDITRNSNSRTIFAAKRYFSEFSKSTFFNEETDAAQPYIVASLERLKTIIGDVYQNTAPSETYQEVTITVDQNVTVLAGDTLTQANTNATAEVRYDVTDSNEITLVKVSGVWSENIADDTLQALNAGPLTVFVTAYDDSTLVTQNIDQSLILESGAYLLVTELMDYLITAISLADTTTLPRVNQSSTTTILVKSGTYSETLPITVPDNCAVIGDELRSTVIQPKVTVYTYTTLSSTGSNTLVLNNMKNVESGLPIQFSAETSNDDFGGDNLVLGQTYYIKDVNIDNKTITISETIDGDAVELDNGTGFMTVYAGDCLKDMFYLRNATGLRNCTLTGLAGSLSAPNQFTTRRPTGGAYTSLDPGTGPDDTVGWIIDRSPYVQNVTNFGVGCSGLKIDGTLHNGGYKSIVCNDYTQILSDGIGVWCTGTGSLTECVSVFTYYNYAGYFAEDGGRIRATNGNSSYGTFGVVAEGFDETEEPISGLVDNQSVQVQATVQSAFGANAEILSLQYNNAGLNYIEATTNISTYSNGFDQWATDNNVLVQQNTSSPFGGTDAWTLTAKTANANECYIYNDIPIYQAGAEYIDVQTVNVSGSGNGATFDITVGSTAYYAVVNQGGTGYVASNVVRIPGSQLGGEDGTNDCFLTVTSLTGSSVLNVSVSGTVPTNSAQPYTISFYAKEESSPIIDFEAEFSGNNTVVSTASFDFDTNTFTTSVNGGANPTTGKLELTNGWWRLWMTVYDNDALNSNLRVKIFPRGKNGLAYATKIFGVQVQLTADPTFYLQTTTNKFISHANFTVIGAGTDALLVGDEIRSQAIYEVRITDTGLGAGGKGYNISSNNAQTGTPYTLTLSGSDVAAESEYLGMRVFLQSGTGAGQYGYISSFDADVSKMATILKESFKPLSVVSTSGSTNQLTLSGDTTDTLYVDQRVQFIPTYYSNTIDYTSTDIVNISETIGGSTNTFVVDSTAKLDVNMPVRFSGAVYGGVIEDFTYYIKEVVDDTHIKVSTEVFGNELLLNSDIGAMSLIIPGYNNYVYGSTVNMVINMPIQFTGVSIGGISVGTQYFVNDVIGADKFTISASLVEVEVTDTTAATNNLTVASTTGLQPLHPIEFSGTVFGGIAAGTVYYIDKIVNSTTFTITDTIIETRAAETATTTNLITVDSTAGFIPNNPIQFIGNTFGQIINGNTYYILAVNDATTFTISASPGGSAVNLTTDTGDVLVRTTSTSFALTTSTGSMTGTSTNAKLNLSTGYGSMNGTYSTKLFGNLTKGTTYYVTNIVDSTTFEVSQIQGGAPETLKDDAGSMNIAAEGYDHINPGTPIVPSLDNSTVYYVEPRLEITSPEFSQVPATTNTLAGGTEWISVEYGNGKFIALPSGNSVAGVSTDGSTWDALPLLEVGSWGDIAYGNGSWVITVDGGGIGDLNSKAYYSNSNGEGWRATILPTFGSYTNVVYGNGKFVSIAAGSSDSAYSTDGGQTWSSGSGLPNDNWSSLAYGNGKFVAISSGGNVSAYSSDGINWTAASLPTSSDWSSITFGTGLFVAVSSTGSSPIYSRDGIEWLESPYTLEPLHRIAYGQGVFLALSNIAGVGYTSEDGILWTSRSVSNDAYGAIAFGWVTNDYIGAFVTVAQQSVASIISAGCTTKGRANVTSGRINSISIWEPGSNYAGGAAPELTITDPNVTQAASTLLRVGDGGTLGNPSFINRGVNYNTNSTQVRIDGGGFADTFQTGLTITVKDLTSLPGPGDNLVFDGISQVYKVTSATAVFGTTAPNIKANVQIAPEMSVENSPAHETPITIRQKYSQARLTGHDYLNVGYGNKVQSNYPNLPDDTVLAPQDQAVEINYGRVFYQSTDQDGNFNVGGLFGVEQATGIVTLSASQFGLQGLETLSLGGIAVGGSSVVIRQFSTDETFIANSNNIVPTQRAIKAYLESRLTQGGSNTFTGQLIAGTVLIGGPNRIASTIPEGQPGARVMMPVPVRIEGQFAGWDGDGMAYSYFAKTWNHR